MDQAYEFAAGTHRHSALFCFAVQSGVALICSGRFVDGLYWIRKMEITDSASSLPLYKRLARHISEAIELGTLRPGDRLPSVRSLSLQHKVSLSTALQTYRHLENHALIEARPKSGYFVKGRRLAHAQPAAMTEQKSPLGMNQTVFELMHLARTSCDVRLDIATGPAQIYPTAKLQQLIAGVSRRHPEILTNYPTGTGYPEFKAQIARRTLGSGCRFNPDNIIITSGSTESLNLALRAVTQPGDTVAVESPTYFGILQILETLGLRALEIPTSPITGISLSALDLATGTPNAVQAVVLMPNFHNPLGCVMPDENKRQVVQMLEQRGIALIEDDVHGDLFYGDHRPLALKSFDRGGNVILCNSVTKTLAPGLRLGWMVAGRWSARVEMLKLTSSIVTPELAQAAIAEFMQNGNYDHHMRKFRSAIKKQTGLMRKAVRKYFPPEVELSDPQGGYLLWIALPRQVSSRAVFELARQQSIGIAPGLMFSNSGKFDHYIRLNCANPWSEAIEDSVRKLGEIVDRCATSDHK